MRLSPPSFWFKPCSFWGWVLWPISLIYLGISDVWNALRKPWQAPVPVIGVGNVEMGGVGKTPMVIHLIRLLQMQGLLPHIVSRGYKGTYRQFHDVWRVRVDDSADFVGDEALLLVQHAPVWVTTHRKMAIQRAIAAGADSIVLDDGLQNPTIVKSCQLLLVDGHRLWGNGKVFPAGPLREPWRRAVRRATVMVVMMHRQDAFADGSRLAWGNKPVFIAHKEITIPHGLRKKNCVAFAGIGQPLQFFSQLRSQGLQVVDSMIFPDHHPFTADDEQILLDLKNNHCAVLITTAKDYVRLSPRLKLETTVIPLDLKVDQESDFVNAIGAMIQKGQ